MSRRDIRDPIIVYTDTDGFVSRGFTVVPTSNIARVDRGHYVMVPVLNEQAGDAMLEQLKRESKPCWCDDHQGTNLACPRHGTRS